MEESGAVAAEKEHLLPTGSPQTSGEQDTKIKDIVNPFLSFEPGFAFTSPDSAISKTVRNHHTESRGRQDARYRVALTRGSDSMLVVRQRQRIYTNKTSIIRTSYLGAIKQGLIMSSQ